MDKKHRNDLEPYISETDSSSTTAEAEKDQKVSDALKDSLGTDEEPDFSLEKYFFYENFLKALYVLWRMHEACLKCKELMKVDPKYIIIINIIIIIIIVVVVILIYCILLYIKYVIIIIIVVVVVVIIIYIIIVVGIINTFLSFINYSVKTAYHPELAFASDNPSLF